MKRQTSKTRSGARDAQAGTPATLEENVETIRAWEQSLLRKQSRVEQLASQNRLSRQADKRANLDLQIDLLAEREMTVVLQLLTEI